MAIFHIAVHLQHAGGVDNLLHIYILQEHLNSSRMKKERSKLLLCCAICSEGLLLQIAYLILCVQIFYSSCNGMTGCILLVLADWGSFFACNWFYDKVC